MICVNCGNTISRKKKFCNSQYQKEYQYKEYINKLNAGKAKGIRVEYQCT